MNRLRDRRLERGRGRVWKAGRHWFADFRTPDGTLYCAWDETPEVVTEWIYRKAARHASR